MPPSPTLENETVPSLGTRIRVAVVDFGAVGYLLFASTFVIDVIRRAIDIFAAENLFERLGALSFVKFLVLRGIGHDHVAHFLEFLGAPSFAGVAIGWWGLMGTALCVGVWEWRGGSPAQRLFGFRRALSPSVDAHGRPVAPRSWYRSGGGWIVLALVLVTLASGWFACEVTLTNLVARTRLERMGAIFSELFDFARVASVFDPAAESPKSWATFGDALPLLIETVFLALMATAFAVPVAFGLSFLAARNVMCGSALGRTVYVVTRTGLNVVRSVEPLLWAIVFSVWVSAGTFAGVVALAVHSVAALAKLFSEQIESIEPGPVEAITATGASRLQVIRFAIVPQVIPPMVSFTMYRWDINLRMAPILGFVGGGGIGVLLNQHFGQLHYAEVGVIILLITLVVAALDFTSARIRARLI